MKVMVQKYGESVIWEYGLEALGFPPNWVRTLEEAKKIRELLKIKYVPF
jgi:hypothetical protein